MKKTITLDAGHYGKRNRSPVVAEYYESEAMWKLTNLLYSALKRMGFEVKLTRDDLNKDLAVVARGKKAKGSDLFISLHSNASSDEKTDRVSVYRAYDDKNDASVLSLTLGKTVADTMEVKDGFRDKTRALAGNTGEYYGVLRGARSVGCPLYFIVEHSFHTNTRSAKWLLSDANLRKLATAEANAIAKYFSASCPVSVDDAYLVRGFAAGTTVGEAKVMLKESGYDAAIYKDDMSLICTGDGVYIGNDIYTAVVKGDGSGDGKVDESDRALCKKLLLKTAGASGAYYAALDLDGDGKVGIKDYLLLGRML